MTAEINQIATEVETFVRQYIAAGVAPREVQVRPSGDDVDVIKVWIDLGSAKVDAQAWARDCEAAIKKAIPAAAAFKVAVRVETLA